MTSRAAAVTVAALLTEADVVLSTMSAKAMPLRLMPVPPPAVRMRLRVRSLVSASTSSVPAVVTVAPAAMPATVVLVS